MKNVQTQIKQEVHNMTNSTYHTIQYTRPAIERIADMIKIAHSVSPARARLDLFEFPESGDQSSQCDLNFNILALLLSPE